VEVGAVCEVGFVGCLWFAVAAAAVAVERKGGCLWWWFESGWCGGC
jgi:hypothetical protein